VALDDETRARFVSTRTGVYSSSRPSIVSAQQKPPRSVSLFQVPTTTADTGALVPSQASIILPPFSSPYLRPSTTTTYVVTHGLTSTITSLHPHFHSVLESMVKVSVGSAGEGKAYPVVDSASALSPNQARRGRALHRIRAPRPQTTRHILEGLGG
jgi:hypothetical protein